MATAKSDDESEESSHPLAENRPGVYVQVVAPRRRKKSKRSESPSSSRPPAGKARGGVREETDARVRARRKSDPRVAESEETVPPPSSAPHLSTPAEAAADLSASASEAPTVVGHFEVPAMFGARAPTDSEPATEPGLTGAASAVEEAEEDDGRQSGERPVDFDSVRAREGVSDNSNQRPDLSGMSIPPPPRLPSFTGVEEPAERASATSAPVHSASLLDAPPTLRPGAPESTPAERPSATLLAFVAVLTAIIVTAGFVALRELARRDDRPAATQVRAPIAAPARPAQVAAPARPTQVVPAAPTASANVAPAEPAQAAPAALPQPAGAARGQVAGRPAGAKKGAPGRALVAKANAALRQLSNAGLNATPQGAEPEPAAEEEEVERAPNPDEPLELPVNPY